MQPLIKTHNISVPTLFTPSSLEPRVIKSSLLKNLEVSGILRLQSLLRKTEEEIRNRREAFFAEPADFEVDGMWVSLFGDPCVWRLSWLI
jgi:hypothetical protein